MTAYFSAGDDDKFDSGEIYSKLCKMQFKIHLCCDRLFLIFNGWKKFMKTVIQDKTLDEERALYFTRDAKIMNCIFAGKADGESALKECSSIEVSDCKFSLRYPLWHTKNFSVKSSIMDTGCRAALWYASDGSITNTVMNGIKAVRECNNIFFSGCQISSEEFGWKSRLITLEDTQIKSEYIFLDSRDVILNRVKMSGKYSFQYVENMTITDSELDTKDAFWHTHNVTVRNSIVSGEYLGWYSDGLTLENCTIRGTQPLCYCKNLRLINCTMENCDLAFEYSDVQADIRGTVDSVKNIRSGTVTADSVLNVIHDNPVMTCTGVVVQRES